MRCVDEVVKVGFGTVLRIDRVVIGDVVWRRVGLVGVPGDGPEIDHRRAEIFDPGEAGNRSFQGALTAEGIGPQFVDSDFVQPLGNWPGITVAEGQVLRRSGDGECGGQKKRFDEDSQGC